MKKLVIFCLALFLVGGIASMAVAEEAAAPPPPKPALVAGDMVPAWSGVDISDGKAISSDALKGKEYALVFVNSSCAACRKELSDLKSRDFTGKLEVVIVSMDATPDRAKIIFRDKLKLPYTIISDADQIIASGVDLLYSPASVIVDKDGKLEFRFGGYGAAVRDKVMAAFDKYAK